MNLTVSSITVMFEDPFWIGLYEREWNGRYEVCKITFGAEPKDCQVYEYLLKYHDSLRFSPAVETEHAADARINPKRMQRMIQKQLSVKPVSTKAQQALSLQREQQKTEKQAVSKSRREEEKERRLALKQQKRKEKHRGH